MGYQHQADLPKSARDHLPRHAQEIYRAAFNNAWEEYNHDEERAHRVAWAAVKEEYEKKKRPASGKRSPKRTLAGMGGTRRRGA